MSVSSVNKPAVQPSEAAKRPAAQRQSQEAVIKQRAAETPPKTQESKPKPVVNAQGQVTGRHLNVSA